MLRIAILITCHNRRETTLRCLRDLQAQKALDGYALEIHLVDDGSSDGTADAVSAEFPDVNVIRADGSRYWTGGMIVADQAAWPTQPDYLLWLNDDVQLVPDAIRTLCDTSVAARDAAIVVGAMQHPGTGRAIYGGHARMGGRHSLALACVDPTGSPLAVDTINGNAVLLPRAVRERVGTLDGQFTHAMADMDYGYRAAQLGVELLLAPKFLGSCGPNERKGRWRDPQLGLRERWRELTSYLGLPPREWLAYTRRHTGWQWPRWFLGPYIHCILVGVRPRGAREAEHVGVGNVAAGGPPPPVGRR